MTTQPNTPEQPKREAWDELTQNQREAIIAAIDEGGYIQEFGPSYNRFALRDFVRGLNVALATQQAELERVKVELAAVRGLERHYIGGLYWVSASDLDALLK